MRFAWILILLSACEHGTVTWIGEPVEVRYPHVDSNGPALVEEITLEDQGIVDDTGDEIPVEDTDNLDTLVVTESGEIMANGYDEDGDGADLCWADLDSDGFGDTNNPRIFSLNWNPRVLDPSHPCQLLNFLADGTTRWVNGPNVTNNDMDPDDQNSRIPVND